MSVREISQGDVLVLGGGAVGLSIAARLAGQVRVLLLEREAELAYHTTGRSAAMFTPHYGEPAMRALTLASAAFFAAPPAPFAPFVYAPRQVLHLAGAAQQARLKALMESAPAAFERLDGAEARRLWPGLRDHIIAGALETGAGDIDVDALVQGYRALLRAAGAPIVTALGPTAIEHGGGQWRVLARAGEYRAPILINAAGAWADEVARAAGVAPVALTPLRRTVALIDPPDDPAFKRRPTVFDVDERFYFRPFAGSILVTHCDETPSAPCDAAPTEEDVARAVAAYESAVEASVRRVQARWAGLRTFARDRAPVLGAAPGAEGFIWAAGLGGSGIQTAPAVGALVADLVLGADGARTLDARMLAAVSPARASLRAAR